MKDLNKFNHALVYLLVLVWTFFRTGFRDPPNHAGLDLAGHSGSLELSWYWSTLVECLTNFVLWDFVYYYAGVISYSLRQTRL